MKQNFDQSLQWVLKDEGGYTNNPSDPGGPTNFGITIADYRKYINRNGTASDVRKMNLDDAKRIYKSAYWDALGCDGLPGGVDYCVFDYGVNSGIGRAKRVLAKFTQLKNPVDLINAICDERMAFLRRLSTFSVFGTGWTRRVSGVRSNSIKLTKAPVTKTAAASTAVVAAGTVAAATTHAHPHLWPYFAFGSAVVISIALAIYLYHYFKGKTQ